jgi:hypothetical protein
LFIQDFIETLTYKGSHESKKSIFNAKFFRRIIRPINLFVQKIILDFLLDWSASTCAVVEAEGDFCKWH